MTENIKKQATRIHKSILGYSKDKSMAFPEMLARDVLTQGVENPDLTDEIYVQIIKQLSQNKNEESVKRLWQMMCMCVGTFPPSAEFEFFLLHFLLNALGSEGIVADYAKYAYRRVEGILAQGASGFVPTVEEIDAYNNRPPILVSIELVDGSALASNLPITPDLDVGKVLVICNHFLDVEDERKSHFGIFAVSNDFVSPLKNIEFMGDVIARASRRKEQVTFTFKRKIIIKKDEIESEDEMFNRLMFLQVVDDFIEGLHVVENMDEISKKTADAIYVDCDGEAPEDAEALIDDACMVEYIPKYIRDQYDESEWCEKILPILGGMEDEPDDVQDKFLAWGQEQKWYGSLCFQVKLEPPKDKKKLPKIYKVLKDDMNMFLNSDGLYLCDGQTEISHWGYADIYRWGGSGRRFSAQMWDAEAQATYDLRFLTKQGEVISNYLLDMIEAIMAST